MKTLTIVILIVSSFSLFAQKDSSFYKSNITRKHYYLKPLQKVNGTYYYGERRLSGFNSLEVPFFELNDPIVNYHFKRYKIFNGVGQAISFIPTIYILSTLNKARTRQSGYYSGTYLGMLGVSLVGSITCNIIGKAHIKRAAIRYNQALGQPTSANLQLKPDENSLGLALRFNFK